MPDEILDSNKEIETRARETHYKLREKLIELRKSPPSAEESLQFLRTKVASLMRALYDDHLALYQNKGYQVSEADPKTLRQFYEWCRQRVRPYADIRKIDVDSSVLRKKDKKRWEKIFSEDLCSEKNHWNIVIGPTSQDEWADVPIHEQLALSHVIGSYFPKRETNIFAVGIHVGDQEHSGGYGGYGIGVYSEKPRGSS